MTKRHWFLFILTTSLLLTPALACSKNPQPQATPTSLLTALPTGTSPPPSPIPVQATEAPALVLPTPAIAPAMVTVTPPSGPAVWNVQFALDVEPNGELVFPATAFVSGVSRVYVRFSYQELGGVTEMETNWYLNENLASVGKLTWDGDDAGDYIIWVEDPDGLGRGEWRWELLSADVVLGGGAFTIGGEPTYTNADWGISFDPPVTWQVESEQGGFVTFSSPDGLQALALSVGPGAADILAQFQADYAQVEVVETQEVTMSGEEALLQHVRYTDPESGEQFLVIVSALHAGSTYSLWVLGPAGDAETLQSLLVTTLHSVRFLDDK